jgi:amidase
VLPRPERVSTLPENVLQHIHEQETAGETRVADQGLVRETACAVVGKLKSGEVTPLDLLDVLEKRIAKVDGPVNALPTLCFDRARKHARALMEKPVAERGLLAGLPIPIKDLTAVAGVLTTQGSPIYKDNIPAKSDILVEHLENNGGVIYAKSNTPEFGAGANTFNEVFGPTRNPWDTSRSAAGSSGGAAVALATGTAWLAHGSDMGGSLRNPASFCGIVGMRPSIGRVAHTLAAAIDRNLGVQGPMARNVEDVALLLDAMSGEHPAIPCRCRFCRIRSCPPRAPARNRNASPIRPIWASRRSIQKSHPSPARRRSVSRNWGHCRGSASGSARGA